MTNQEQHDNFSYWGKILQETPESYKQWFEAEKAYLDRHVRPHSQILEVGCGEGRSLSYLTEKRCRLYGIDYDKRAALSARSKLKDQEMGANILLMQAKDLIFKDSVFDYVLSLTTPANFASQKKQIYSEMKRVLKPLGEIILNVFNEDAFPERIQFYKRLVCPIKEIRGTTVIFEGDDFISEQFSRTQLENLAKDNGLNVIDISKAGIGYLCRFEKRV